jgi:spermidine synthase
MPFNFLNWWVVVALHAIAFFSTAMVCHQKLAGGRPRPEHLTEFYLCVAAGGVIGGAATAFLAPVVFKTILEYPLVLVLAGLARPTLAARPRPVDWIVLAASLICATVLAVLYRQGPMSLGTVLALLTVGAIAAIVVKRHRLLFVAAVALLALQVTLGLESKATLYSARTFFGVHRVAYAEVPELGGAVHLLVNGNTLHGAQALVPAFECRQTNYYVREGAIGQVYTDMQARHARMRMGVVGLGGGTIAAYVRKGDSLRFFEIDPEVERIARDRRYFTYLSDCPKGPVDVVLGDARLTLGHEAPASYDLIHLDAFTSAAIPTHLLTVEAIEQYLRLLKPDGVLLLHISNRHLALEGPVAAAKRLGVLARVQNYRTARGVPLYVAESSDVMVVTRSPEAMAVFANDSRWRVPRTGRSRAWTDDYTNVLGAMIAKSLE